MNLILGMPLKIQISGQLVDCKLRMEIDSFEAQVFLRLQFVMLETHGLSNNILYFV
jgi:hypothetical protein